jgi:cyclopropane-fatty-acyl-phospholipid synthase
MVIARRPGPRSEFSPTSFFDRYVFPDGELERFAMMVDALEHAGFEVRDVASSREHYDLILRAWITNLEAAWERAVGLTSGARARFGACTWPGRRSRSRPIGSVSTQ